ncbi:hypothetical protein [Campylobacter concisus]
MKISFECECILLQKTLLLFCGNLAANHKDCDFVVSDREIATKKPLFIIGKNAHLSHPFTKMALLDTLEEFYSAMQISKANELNEAKNEKGLEEKISLLIDKFKADLLEILRANQ